MNAQKLVLGSGSPRRKDLLENLNLDFEIFSPDINEDPHPNENSREYVRRMAAEKSDVVAAEYGSEVVAITGDTTVAYEDKILGKADSRQQAADMLTQLSGKTHSVITSVCIVNGSYKILQLEKSALVQFKKLTTESIEKYLDHNHWQDKAGAYALQEDSIDLLLEKVIGDYFAIVGLPIVEVAATLFDLGFAIKPEILPNLLISNQQSIKKVGK